MLRILRRDLSLPPPLFRILRPFSSLCPGCGVHLQPSSPSLPGFFSPPSAPPPPPPPIDPSLLPLPLKSGLLPPSPPPPSAHSKPLVCARCHSLRHYGCVKNPSAEPLLPDFDFESLLAPRITSASGARSVVLALADASDFDGSFPRRVAAAVARSADENSRAWKHGLPGNVPRMLVVMSKIDLLPAAAVSPTGLEYWARHRARECWAGRIDGVHLVSAVRGWGVRNLVEHASHLAGPRGRVWAVGAQNVGKSTLINSMGLCVGGKENYLTEAPVPGTTLGVMKVDGVLSGDAKLFDTPGILHPHQLSTRLTREEQRLVHIGKELRPRTYRIKAGHSIHIAGLMRLDIEETSVDTIYVTVWASPLLPLHMGKTENSCKFVEDHFGRRLQPPIGENRVRELGNWIRKGFHVCGKTWNASSVDIAAAGLGWFAICLSGEAILGAWTYDGVDVVLRNSLIPARAKIFEEAGFTVSKILSEAESALSKEKSSKKKKAHGGEEKPLGMPLSTADIDASAAMTLGQA